MTKVMPHEDGIDHTLSLVREGYMYIQNRRRSFNSDIFETRLFGQKVICMSGKEAAEVFYDNEKFKRKGAAPNRLIQTLFGKNGVQGLDGQKHKHRKDIFMSLMSPENLKRLGKMAKEQWYIAINKWSGLDEIVFYEEVQVLLCKTACQWAGVPVPDDEIKNLTNHLEAMFESPMAIGPNHWRGRHARNHVENWMGDLIEKVRNGDIQPADHTALHQFSLKRDADGNLLDNQTAAVEVINIIRPIVAIAIYINFTILALHHYPEEREKLEKGNEKDAEMFVQEVRRFYPFFPLVAAIVKDDFIFNGYTFKKDTLAFLDLYGTNHDPTYWKEPDIFNSGRFENWDDSPFGFIPQGGGDYFMGHRCAGEWVTVEIMKVSLDCIIKKMSYEWPDQDLSYSMVKIPSIPHSKIKLTNVRCKN